ncbi:TonB-dependent receptor domain-containing protein [Granulicella arctica]|uniref:TonB-dependent receptor domain-containing protein n=1 Tax=Granulicella arctica TaxID=940613 RepID=UPI0021E03D15|nr:TonB-dependent receptor [Granulicella arctica]
MKSTLHTTVLKLGLTCATLTIIAPLLFPAEAIAQADQGAITGFVKDPTGAVIPNADVTVVNTDTGLSLNVKSNSSGVFVFAPLKIGNYSVTATAPNFAPLTQTGLRVDIQTRLGVNLTLQPGSVAQTIDVGTQAPLLQTQDGSVQQVISAQSIDNTPLNGRNFVYIAQLTAGIAPPGGNTRGAGSGDFVANGQRATQNNFILDGVDNNTNLVDFLNGQTYVVRPPPDALAEFAVQTSSFSSEFGHSAGAVVNASIKSGTNQIHGSLWEYLRNTAFDAKDWEAQSIPVYHENQFGATLGLPILKNRLFYFGDIEANRIARSNPGTYSVPTALMRKGDFTELLNSTLNGQSVQLYQPNSGGGASNTLQCNGRNNVYCANQINAVAQNILNLYPLPNANGGKTTNNYVVNTPTHNNTVQWDQRIDWNATARDQAYARYSYSRVVTLNGLPLGPILDGTGYGGERDLSFAQDFVFSETHFFTPSFTNEFRFGFNAGKFSFLQPNANVNLSPTLGLGGVPFSPNEGGLPLGIVYGISQWGSVGTSNESQNVYQILDNASKTIGKHNLRVGASMQSIRFFNRYAPSSLGNYYFTGLYTSDPALSNKTGSGVADFLADQMNTSALSSAPNINNALWYDAAYVQDDWKLTSHLTVNLGLRYDYYEPYKENSHMQENFIPGSLGFGTGTGTLILPKQIQNTVSLGTRLPSILAKDGIGVSYIDNERLVSAQLTNFAPRIGIAYQLDPQTAVRAGYGIFYGGLESQGGTNLGDNFPFRGQLNVNPVSCSLGNCPSNGITLESGEGAQFAAGFLNAVSNPGFHAVERTPKTPYTMNYNLSFQRQVTPSMAATISYVGNVSRHLSTYYDPNTVRGLYAPGTQTQAFQPFPDLGGIGTILFAGVSTYNSLQAKLEKRASHGLTFLSTYTWAHALDDTSSAGGLSTAIGDRNMAIIPFIDEYTNSVYDVRNRFTFNGNYELPFGVGRAHLTHHGVLDEIAGGWSGSATWVAQSGSPFTVGNNNNTAAGGSARAILVGDPYAPGGTPDPTSGLTPDQCPTQTRTRLHYYNPCSFRNPLPGNLIAPVGTAPTAGQIAGPITDEATAIRFLGGRQNVLYGPGYYSVNASLFKNFTTFREQYLQFRADVFNVFNHPTLGNPSDTSLDSNAGQITGPKFFQNNTPDSRFFQLALRYAF